MFHEFFFFLLLFYSFLRTHPMPVFISCQIPSERFGFCFERLPLMLIFQPGFLNYAGRVSSDQEIERRGKFVLFWMKVFRVLSIPKSQYLLLYFPPYMSVKSSSPLHWSRTKLEDLYYKVRRTVVKLEHLKQYDTGTKIGFIDQQNRVQKRTYVHILPEWWKTWHCSGK